MFVPSRGLPLQDPTQLLDVSARVNYAQVLQEAAVQKDVQKAMRTPDATPTKPRQPRLVYSVVAEKMGTEPVDRP